jgi:pimeloyl-ACP methyl ester carboxylesterase
MSDEFDSIILRDGRTLSYAIYGDPQGKPAFFFHGTPGSRLFRPDDEITRLMSVRLICVDRPGYGRSTYQPERRILDWPGDIAQLADRLSIEKFALIGHSGGGPHVLACAYALPQRVISASTLSGGGPPDAPGAADGLIFMNRLGFMLGRYAPWMLWQPLTWAFNRQRCADPGMAIDVDTRKGIRPPADEHLIQRPDVRQLCIASEVEGFRQGLLGFTWDARLITRLWGFPLERIHVPVHLWHGTADNVTNMAMARHMAAKIPGCTAHFLPDEGHLLLLPHWQDILSCIL